MSTRDHLRWWRLSRRWMTSKDSIRSEARTLNLSWSLWTRTGECGATFYFTGLKLTEPQLKDLISKISHVPQTKTLQEVKGGSTFVSCITRLQGTLSFRRTIRSLSY